MQNYLQAILVILILSIFSLSCSFQTQIAEEIERVDTSSIITGAEKVGEYINFIKNKRVALVANHTSIIGNKHLVDSLLSLNITIVKIFSPEHGFRGNFDAGSKWNSYKDAKTGITVISLYGDNKKPKRDDLKNVDVILFDIQDVGARFYTYISTMHYVMESCAENKIDFIVLDRPNPNGFYVDGPILNLEFKSFVGMHPVPLVHGMTVAEYAKMINEEGWLKDGIKCKLGWVLCDTYDHSTHYRLPVNPSPNLQNMRAIYLYPSLALFEGTDISVGRGTDYPFEIFGCPSFTDTSFSFVPRSIPSIANDPMHKNERCYGVDLRYISTDSLCSRTTINLEWLITAYTNYPEKEKFFTNFFNTLVGGSKLKEQIIEGKTEDEIRKSWQKELTKFKTLRKKYLLYQDFDNNLE